MPTERRWARECKSKVARTKLVVLANEHNVEVLFTPPGHSELQPIEMAWSGIKGGYVGERMQEKRAEQYRAQRARQEAGQAARAPSPPADAQSDSTSSGGEQREHATRRKTGAEGATRRIATADVQRYINEAFDTSAPLAEQVVSKDLWRKYIRHCRAECRLYRVANAEHDEEDVELSDLSDTDATDDGHELHAV